MKTIHLHLLKEWMQPSQAIKHLFRYQKLTLLTKDLRAFPKPFKKALLLRLFCFGKCFVQDEKGNVLSLSFPTLFSLFTQFIQGFFKKKRLLEQTLQKLSLFSQDDGRKILKEGRSVYFRVDYFFDLESGGSIGHIAGVLNQLKNPLFITSSPIPTVRADIETHRIYPPTAFSDFNDLAALHYNSAFYREAKEILKNKTISFIYQRYSTLHYATALLAKEMQLPFVLEYNGPGAWTSKWWGKKSKYEGLMEEIEEICLKEADLIVVVSSALKQRLLQKGIEGEKILMSPNAVDLDVYSPQTDPTPICKKYRLEGKKVIGFIGTFGKWHGAQVLAEAFSLLLTRFPELKKDICLFLIGDGDTLFETKKILEKANLLSFCRCSGAIEQALGPSHLAACDILVSPQVPNLDGSPFFGSPTKIFEYMAMGKGIIASSLGQIKEVLSHEKTALLVEPNDPLDLMQAIKRLLDDEALCLSLGKEARKVADQKHSWEKHTQTMLEKLKELCS